MASDPVGDTPHNRAAALYYEKRLAGGVRTEILDELVRNFEFAPHERQALAMTVGRWEKKMTKIFSPPPEDTEAVEQSLAQKANNILQEALTTGPLKDRLAAAKEVRKTLKEDLSEENVYAGMSGKELIERLVQLGVSIVGIEDLEATIKQLRETHQLEVSVPDGWVPEEVREYERRKESALEVPGEGEGDGSGADAPATGSGEAGST